MVEQVTIDTTAAKVEPTLEQQALDMGIDPNKVDPNATQQTAEPRPAWLPEKFKSVEELAASYTELEKKLGQGNKPTEPPVENNQDQGEPPKNDDGNEPPKSDEDLAKEVTDQAGLNFDELSTKYWEKGDLDPEDYEKFEKVGITKDIIQQFAEGQKAIVAMRDQEVFNTVGGEKNYRSMLEWAKDNYTEAEVEAYNNAVYGRDPSARTMAVKGLEARFKADRGFEPSRTIGGKTNAPVERYASIPEMQADMRDPRYQTDPAFRARVAQKLERSDIM